MSRMNAVREALPEFLVRTINDSSTRLQSELVRIRRHLHAFPEPSGAEFETTRFLEQQLNDLGVASRVHPQGTGLLADLTIGRPDSETPLVGIRADIDALRIVDEKTTDYTSRKAGLMHACGHDAHAAMVIGTAMVASKLAESWESHGKSARLRLIFQPAEEICQGARWMVDQGATAGLAWILGLHVDPERAAGRIGVRQGALTAHCDEIHFVLTGQGGHAARPHQSRDPLLAATELMQLLYSRMPRTCDARQPAVFSIGSIHGGSAPNAIPDKVEIQGTLRTTDSEVRARLLNRIQEICTGLEQISRVRIEPRFLNNLQAVINHPCAVHAVERACNGLGIMDRVDQIALPSMGGEDFSIYLGDVPGAMFRIGCARAGADPCHLHSSRFDIDEDILSLGTRLLLLTALELGKPDD